MKDISRRRFLQATGLLTATAVAGCGSDDGSAGRRDGLTWWDHFGPLEDLHQQMFDEWAQTPDGVPVEYTRHQAESMGQAMQLARTSDQLPDVHSLAGLQLPAATLHEEGWFQPAQFDDETLARFADGALVEGVTMFGGEVYSFPIFSFRQHTSANWYNRELLEQADLDPDSPPTTYDEFRAACAEVKKKTGAHGFVFPFKAPDGGAAHVRTLAQAGGFEGDVLNAVDFRTGEFSYHSEQHLAAFEFLLSLQQDGHLLPGSTSMNGKQARARWAAGAAAFWFEGPWCPGVVVQDLTAFADKMDVGPLLVPEEGMTPVAYTGPIPGAFFLSDQSQNPEQASAAMALFSTEEYSRRLAENMDQPPADLSVIDDVDVHPSYRKAIEMYKTDVFLAPAAIVGNSDVARVEAKTTPVSPDLGAIIAGTFSGQISDVANALKELSDRASAARDDAIAAAQSEGAEVDLDTYAFDNWQPRTDYASDMYPA